MQKMMKAQVVREPYVMEYTDVPVPVIAEDEVLIKIKVCGICGSDWSIYTGKYASDKLPLITGHEFWGEIAEVVEHNIQMGGVLMHGDWQRLDKSFRFRIPGWGDVPWKKVITELSLVGYDYVLSYEHEDVTMSVGDGVEKVAAYLKPLLIKAPYEGRKDKIFNIPAGN